MIKSFKCKDTQKLASNIRVRKFVNFESAARRKLLMLEAATSVEDLKLPPGNRLHQLEGDRKGQYSISINDQWRVCFRWENGDAHEVEIVDYH